MFIKKSTKYFFIILLVIGISTAGCGEANAIIVKDCQIVLLKRGAEYALVIPIEQTKSQAGYSMKFKYANSVDSLEKLKAIKIENLPEDIVYDNDKITIGNISATWTFRANGAGYLYYGEIFGNYSIPVEICVTGVQDVHDVDFSLEKYNFLMGENKRNKRFRP